MSGLALAGGLAYRTSGAQDSPPVLLVHGYPESSYMWRHALVALADAGWRGIAPDLPGFGDSEPAPAGSGTWEHHIDALARFVGELRPGPVVLVTHDWGVMIGLRWACEQPDAIRGLVISDGGFFADRRWHDLANVMRTPKEGEKLIRAYTREGFGAAMQAVCRGIDEQALAEYWKAFADDHRRLAHLELYRSGDFEKLSPYEGRLTAIDAPALIMWGGEDRFAGVGMAQRFHEQLDGSQLVVLDDAGHFVWEDQPERTSAALVDFLARRLR